MISDFELEERGHVFVATKTRKTLQEAPAIVTVITAEQIEAGGFRTLNEVLHTVPGFEHSTTSRWDFLFTRGNAFTLLVLLDGVPIVNPGDNLVFLDQAYPVTLIKRVEVVSGPGGILWGANAYLGVVNIVTLDGADLDGGRAELVGGTHNTLGASVAYGRQLGKLDVMVHASVLTTNEGKVDVRRSTLLLPPDFAFPPDDEDPSSPSVYNPNGAPLFQPGGGTDPSNDYFFDFFGKASWRGLELAIKVPIEKDYYQVSSSTGALLGNGGRESFDRDPSRIVALSYENRFVDQRLGVRGKSYLFSQDFEVESVLFPASDETLPHPFVLNLQIDEQRRIGNNFEVDYQLPFGNTVLAGTEYSRDSLTGARLGFFGPNTGRHIDGGELVPDASTDVYSAYVHDEQNLFERVAVSGGLRYNASDSYASVLVKSAAVVAKVADYDALLSYIKLSYAEGFRPPSFEQRYSTDPLFLGDKDISPEESRAIQIELNARTLRQVRPFKHLNLRADYAYTTLDGTVGLTPYEIDCPETGECSRFDNTGRRRVNSIEAAAELLFTRGHSLWVGYAWNDVRDETAKVDILNNARHVVNGGAVWQVHRNLSLNLRYSWVSAKTIPGYLDPESIDSVDLAIDGYHLASAGATLHDEAGRYKLAIHGYNLLAQHYENVDGDVGVAPYPYPQPDLPVVMAKGIARF